MQLRLLAQVGSSHTAGRCQVDDVPLNMERKDFGYFSEQDCIDFLCFSRAQVYLRTAPSRVRIVRVHYVH